MPYALNVVGGTISPAVTGVGADKVEITDKTMAPHQVILSVRRVLTLTLHASIAAAAAFTCLDAAEKPPAVEAERKADPIYRLDLSAFNTLDLENPAAVKRAWDTTQLAVSIQGNVNNPLFPASGPATGSFNGLHPKSKFLAATPFSPPPVRPPALSINCQAYIKNADETVRT